MRQAELLGRALKEQGFDGTVYSSPYFRAIETAQIIADVTDSVVLPTPEIREYVIREDQMDDFSGATMEELSTAYTRVTEADTFPYPWWTTSIESNEDMVARVSPLVDRLAGGDHDALLVGHGASAAGVHRHILGRHALDRIDHGQIGWNCFLSSFRFAPDFRVLRLVDVSHLPDDAITSNAKTRAEVLAERDD